MPSVPTYPKSHAVIKASKRNYNAVLAAVQAVNQTKAAVIATMGGILVVAGLVWGAICALAGQLCTIAAVMMKMRNMAVQQFMSKYDDAAYAILANLA